MEHSLPLISTLVIGFMLALVFGFIAERFLKAPALVGYLLAGIAAGPFTPGVYADPELAHQFSEVGVMLLMFGVGLHFSIKDLLSVKGIAVPGAVLQMLAATVLGAVAAHTLFDRHWVEAFALGLSLSCASTVVLLKALEVRGILSGPDGRIAVGWLVVEDLATVVILVMLPPLAEIFAPGTGEKAAVNGVELAMSLGKTLLGAVAFVVVMLLAGRRVLPWAMAQVAKTGSRELFTLFVLACAVGVAYGAAEIFHVSFALGAFFAGMVMQESRFAHRAATESLPLQDAFAVLFFVAVGMLFDWRVLVENPWEVLAVLFTIIFGKSICAFLLVWALKYPLHTALTVAVSLAQIGEFSFILVGQAEALGLAKPGLVNLIVAGAILSIALNPVCFGVIPHVAKFLTSRWAWARKAAMRTMPYESLPPETEVEAIHGQVVVAGNDPFIEIFARYLSQSKVPMVVLTANEAIAKRLSDASIRVVSGLLSKEESWVAAHLHNAQRLILVDSSADAVAAALCARRVSPEIPIVVATKDDSLWAEAGVENVRSLLTADAAARLLAVKVEAAVKDNIPLGEPIESRHGRKDEDAKTDDAGASSDASVAGEDRRAAAEGADAQESEAEAGTSKAGKRLFSGLRQKFFAKKAQKSESESEDAPDDSAPAADAAAAAAPAEAKPLASNKLAEKPSADAGAAKGDDSTEEAADATHPDSPAADPHVTEALMRDEAFRAALAAGDADAADEEAAPRENLKSADVASEAPDVPEVVPEAQDSQKTAAAKAEPAEKTPDDGDVRQTAASDAKSGEELESAPGNAPGNAPKP